ncbi:MAG: DNA polymerase III subunit gamma/tau, partial [Syntrophobacteraceae bacterium]|nr:DNA polymerase III subunit gamma/tau [Syntrophobacteraceae bacterium]
MSYLVIARKWRPQRLDEVIGQPHVTKTLVNAIRSHRVAHAYLFTGPRGVGKTSVARILAKTLNCENEPELRPCNACSNCREITRSSSVDVLEIDGASNRGIDNIRELRETVRYRPAKSPFKIYIIDEVHMLTTEAFNALLKTLEEPPDHVIFIFATTEPHKIPATILSRCQRFDFRRIATQLIVTHLSNVAQKESVEVSEAVLYAIAREADGSMRDAQSLLEQLLAFSGAGLSDEELLDVLGVVDRRTVVLAGDAILRGDARACIQVVEKLYLRGIDCRRFCQHLCDHFRNILFVSICGEDANINLDMPGEEKERLWEESRNTSPESLHLIFQ